MNKLKRLLTVFSVITCLALCTCLVVGCGDRDGSGAGSGDSSGGDNQNPPEHTTHNWSAIYTDDDDLHYQTCDGCDEKNYGYHVYIDGTCICGKAEPEEKHIHTMFFIKAKEATCTDDGTVAYWICYACDKKFADEDGNVELTDIVDPQKGHSYGEWETVKEADCTSKGSEKRVCERDSSHVEFQEIPMTPHDYSDEWSADLDNHWHKCKNCYETTEKVSHDWNDDTCVVCNKKNYSEGLIYVLSDSGEGYIVSGTGTCTDNNMVIPAVYNEKPVIGIGENAFGRYTSLLSITIPDRESISDLHPTISY